MISDGELRFMANTTTPLWGGVLKRGGGDRDIDEALEAGLIEPKDGRGYVITQKGLLRIKAICPSCGQRIPQ